MQFIEVKYTGGRKEEQVLEFSDNRTAIDHANKVFLKMENSVSMHVNHAGELLEIWFSSARPRRRKGWSVRSAAQHIVYKLRAQQ